MSLFESQERENLNRAQPLAARMRPQSLAEFVGQQHFLAEGKLLRRLLQADRLGSVIFYGPPGTGKTTLAQLLARESRGTVLCGRGCILAQSSSMGSIGALKRQSGSRTSS